MAFKRTPLNLIYKITAPIIPFITIKKDIDINAFFITNKTPEIHTAYITNLYKKLHSKKQSVEHAAIQNSNVIFFVRAILKLISNIEVACFIELQVVTYFTAQLQSD
ncbi:hypothetical protein ACQKP8_02320 [Photobacterium alginatilyticum]|uniref:hypothetical protein n=1 Tax=Photobacterium alginatilyticum TaxID=1775171 RepID=UPI004067944C